MKGVIRATLAKMMTIFKIMKTVTRIPVNRGRPSMRMATMEHMRQGTPTTNARELGSTEENSSESHAMMDDSRTIADTRWMADTMPPSISTIFGEFAIVE